MSDGDSLAPAPTQRVDLDALMKNAPVASRGFEVVLPDGTRYTANGDLCRIGTHPSNDIQLNDPTVSRFHCEIRIEKGAARVHDLDSSNGLFVDGVHVTAAWLVHASKLRLGRSQLVFHLLDVDVSIPIYEESSFGSMVGASTSMRRMFDILSRCAKTDTTVLLEGETGTGKEEAARSLHEESARADAPFLVIDCGAIPANLLESELFGHERGAFTGAHEARQGVFEAAEGGTVFIDELGELPAELQPKLLRVLEQRTVRRVGGNEQRGIDVRVIAATNRRLEKEVNEGNFRSDLYYRLAVIKVEIPPLRERPEDIAMLTEHILERLDADEGAQARLMSDAFQSKLTRGTWPGNIRELRNYLERSLILEGELPINMEIPEGGGQPFVNANLSWAEARRHAIESFETRYLEALLELHGGNVSKAARSAGMDRVYLHRLIRKHNVR